MPTSMRRCRATFVAVVPISESGPLSNRRHRRLELRPSREPIMGLERRLNVAKFPGVPRRTFLKVGAAGGGLLLGFSLSVRVNAAPTVGDATQEEFAPDGFVRIDREGRVTLVMPQVEMGQGTYTSMSMLIAEELEVNLERVTLEAAPPDDRLYANALIGSQVTGGSTSVRAMWQPLRRAGAAARIMLITAAGRRWHVDPMTCRAENGEVIPPPTGQRLTYGALVDSAARLPVPADVPLKDPKDFRLIGTPAKRLDTPDKVNGKAQFGIDVRIPGMKIATVAACPVFGGKLARVDDSEAMAIKGVRQIVRLDDAVAVVADHMWAALQGLAALDIDWDEGPHSKVSSADIAWQMEIASQKPGVVARKEGDFAKAMAQAVHKVEAIYPGPFLAHATMEPMNCTVHLRADGCDVWVGNQIITRAQATAAEVTGLPLEKVQVHNQLLGGGCGRRLEVDGVTQAVRIAKEVDGPVKVVWTREEDIQHDAYRPYYYDRLAAGLDEQGLPVAWSDRITGSSVMGRWFPPGSKTGSIQMPSRVRQTHPMGSPTSWWITSAMNNPVSQPDGGVALARHTTSSWWRASSTSSLPRQSGTRSNTAALCSAGRRTPRLVSIPRRRQLGRDRRPSPRVSRPRSIWRPRRPVGERPWRSATAVASPCNTRLVLIWRRSRRWRFPRMARCA